MFPVAALSTAAPGGSIFQDAQKVIAGCVLSVCPSRPSMRGGGDRRRRDPSPPSATHLADLPACTTARRRGGGDAARRANGCAHVHLSC